MAANTISYLFILLTVPFVMQIFSLMQSHLFIFAFVIWAFGFISKKSLPGPVSRSFPLCFLLGDVQFQAVNLSFFHSELIFVRFCYNDRGHRGPVFLTPFIEETVLSALCVGGPLVESQLTYMCGFIPGAWFCFIGLYVCLHTNTILLITVAL